MEPVRDLPQVNKKGPPCAGRSRPDMGDLLIMLIAVLLLTQGEGEDALLLGAVLLLSLL